MRLSIRTLVLTSAVLSATAAFAADRAVVNVPFNFESHGIAYSAGRYEATTGLNKGIITLRNTQDPRQSFTWVTSPADATAISAPMRISFDELGSTHELRTIQLGSRITPRLDVHSRHHDAGSFVVAMNGQ
ncbi:hypothetical protein [Silvibacterium dinghuense]|uniref:Uncharacterized protein n=1 Tax=Silvibacterium dinghuense TaxID=1560006 RepID=A0A4Q1S8Z9_9BACT|nr:hypothetical protein [Silvibacterium dinghuense]RXS93369.1 hypothetical protein ESZ00_18645 [Silvibacterium dinghuense]GGH05271.1 hypothetical protein GCM10011586_21740 [Silvibacterium dinghuense]